ncbi:MAG TPA: hypothetical protein PLZ95_04280, partial [Bryobacteraceae bacterium]|nr:hypothetical protein [Bryobacteraceae bacterium]
EMRTMIRIRDVLAFLLLSTAQAQQVHHRGVYSDPEPLWATGAKLNELGINAVFVHGGSIDEALLGRAAKEGASVYAEFATLNGKGYVEKHPEAWPINEKGKPAPAATWFIGVCPTDPGFRQYRRKQLEGLLNRFNVAGVWLDYFHWHAQFEDPNPILPETCFNESCLRAFQAHSKIKLPSLDAKESAAFILSKHEKEWRRWRVQVLVDWARDLRAVVKKRRPGALLGLYHCPWTDSESAGARERILGLDLERLNPVFDVLSPMVYHGRMGRSVEWVGQYVRWLSELAGPKKVWPIVQAHSESEAIPSQEFESVMREAASAGADGIMMFTTRAIASDPAKLEVLRRLYREWDGARMRETQSPQ